MSANTNNLMENGPRAKCDQVVFEAIAKAAEIVVGSRCWIDHIPPNMNALSSSRRFNLLVPEVQGVRCVGTRLTERVIPCDKCASHMLKPYLLFLL